MAKRKVPSKPKANSQAKKPQISQEVQENITAEHKMREMANTLTGMDGEIARAFVQKSELTEKMDKIFAKGETPPKELSAQLLMAQWEINRLTDIVKNK